MTVRHRLRLIPVALLAATLTLTACADDTKAAAPKNDLEKQVTDYVECLRKQGADVPDPIVDADGKITFGRPAAGQKIDRDKITEAQQVCGDLPAGFISGLTGMDQTQLQDTALKFAQCMRGEGIELADPDMSKLSAGAFGDLDRDDPEVAAAIEVCQKVWATR